VNESEKVLVRITASQVVRYHQTVVMTKEEWAEIKKLDEKKAADAITSWLDLRDVFDSDDIDYDGFEMIAVNEDDKPIKPTDRYES